MRRLLSWLFTHRHKWQATRYNPWCIVTEQKCRCGAVRHHLFEDILPMDQPTRWRDGPHPGAEA